MPAIGNVVSGIVLLVSNHAINNFHVRITNVPRGVTHLAVILVTKQKRSLVSVGTLDSWYHVGWNE